jgi:hypothetical protein
VTNSRSVTEVETVPALAYASRRFALPLFDSRERVKKVIDTRWSHDYGDGALGLVARLGRAFVSALIVIIAIIVAAVFLGLPMRRQGARFREYRRRKRG